MDTQKFMQRSESVAERTLAINRHTEGFDLMKISGVRTLIKWWGFPYVFQGLALSVFVYLAIIGWNMNVPEGVNGKLFAKTNLVNLVIWGLWWPAMVWAAVLFGRLWCMVCPMELVSNITERMGRAMGIPQMNLHSWLRSGFLILFLYLAIQFLVAGFDIHRIPFYTSLFLWTMLILAAVTGFLFKDRGFCRGFCPVALLLSTYGRGGMLAVRAEGRDKCQACSGKECMMSCHRTNIDGRSCPSLLNPPKLNSNRDCLVCGQCLKSCQPDNMKLLLRRPFSPTDAREPYASWPTTLFVILASGFVTSELCTEWPKAEEYFVWLPNLISHSLGMDAFAGLFEGFWTLLIVPIFLWLLMGLIVKGFAPSTTLMDNWRRMAIPFAVIVSAGHMTKGIAKFNSWVGFFPYAFQEPAGVNTVSQFASKLIATPSPLLSVTSVSIAGMILLTLGAYFSFKEFYYAENPTHLLYATPMLVLLSLWGFIVWGIGFGI